MRRSREPRTGCVGRSANSPQHRPSAVSLDLGYLAVGGQPAADDVDHRLLGPGNCLVAVLELTEHPAGEDLFERSVEDIAGHARIEVGAKLALLLSAGDDPFDPRECSLDLADALLQMRASRHLADEHTHEVGIAPPRA